FFQAEDGIRDRNVTGVQTCALPISAFFGLGAYGMAIVTLKLGIDPQVASMLGLLVGVALPMVIAGLIGYFLIFGGVRAAYLTIVTLVLPFIAHQVAFVCCYMIVCAFVVIGVHS